MHNEIKMRFAIVQDAFNRKILLLTSILNIELAKKNVRCYVWIIALYGPETWKLRKLERMYLESFEMRSWRRKEKIKWSGKVINEIQKRLGVTRAFLNKILREKPIGLVVL